MKGLYTAIITPFKEDLTIDWQTFEQLVEKQIEAGVKGIVFVGTTGESATLSHDEHIEVLKWSAQTIRYRCEVVHSTGSNNTSESIYLSQKAGELGADAQLVLCPYYNKPTKKGLIEHYTKIADVKDAPPLILYNIKGRTALNIDSDTIVELAQHPNIKAVKEASDDLGQMLEILRTKPSDFSLLSGDDGNVLPLIAAGASGVISVISNVAPKSTNQLINSCLEGDWAQARSLFYKLLPIVDALFLETNPIPVKLLSSLLGYSSPYMRLPLVPASQEVENILKGYISQIQALENEYNRR